MSNRTLGLSDQLYAYVLQASLREPPLLRELREHTAHLPQASMQIAPEQGQFMQLMLRCLGARRVLEIGTFTGYSALAMALALPSDGQIVTCDISREWTDIARAFWRRAEVAHKKIELRLGDADQTLRRLVPDRSGEFDFAFIDADKVKYPDYYELSMALVRAGGVIAVDNTLWGGAVADPDARDEDTEAIRRFNRQLAVDTRVDLSLVPIADGLTLARKRLPGEVA